MKKLKDNESFKKIFDKLKSPKFRKYGIPTIAVLLVLVVALVLFGGLDGLMGNSVFGDYTCDGVWGAPIHDNTQDSMKGNKCYRTYDISSYLLGDVNSDNKVTIDDATLVQQIISGKEELDSMRQATADVNEDSKVNVNDATMIQAYANQTLDVTGTVGTVGSSVESNEDFKKYQSCIADVAKNYDFDAENFENTPEAEQYELEVTEKCQQYRSTTSSGSTGTVGTTSDSNSPRINDSNIGVKRVCPVDSKDISYKISSDNKTCKVTMVKDALKKERVQPDTFVTVGTSGTSGTSGTIGGTQSGLYGVYIEEVNIPDPSKVYTYNQELELNLRVVTYGQGPKYYYRRETFYNVNASNNATRNFIDDCNPLDVKERQISITMYANNRTGSLKVYTSPDCTLASKVAEYTSGVYKATLDSMSVKNTKTIKSFNNGDFKVELSAPLNKTVDKAGLYTINFDYAGTDRYYARYGYYEEGSGVFKTNDKCYKVQNGINRIQHLNITTNKRKYAANIYKTRSDCDKDKKANNYNIGQVITDYYTVKK